VVALKRLKDNVAVVETGVECGITLDGFDDIQPDDLIEIIEIKKPWE
jgi:translation initiation factor IF-2